MFTRTYLARIRTSTNALVGRHPLYLFWHQHIAGPAPTASNFPIRKLCVDVPREVSDRNSVADSSGRQRQTVIVHQSMLMGPRPLEFLEPRKLD